MAEVLKFAPGTWQAVQFEPLSPGDPDLAPLTPPEKENRANVVMGIKNKESLKR